MRQLLSTSVLMLFLPLAGCAMAHEPGGAGTDDDDEPHFWAGDPDGSDHDGAPPTTSGEPGGRPSAPEPRYPACTDGFDSLLDPVPWDRLDRPIDGTVLSVLPDVVEISAGSRTVVFQWTGPDLRSAFAVGDPVTVQRSGGFYPAHQTTSLDGPGGSALVVDVDTSPFPGEDPVAEAGVAGMTFTFGPILCENESVSSMYCDDGGSHHTRGARHAIGVRSLGGEVVIEPGPPVEIAGNLVQYVEAHSWNVLRRCDGLGLVPDYRRMRVNVLVPPLDG